MNPRTLWVTLTDVALFVLLAVNIAAVIYLLIVWAPNERGYDPSQEEVLITF